MGQTRLLELVSGFPNLLLARKKHQRVPAQRTCSAVEFSDSLGNTFGQRKIAGVLILCSCRVIIIFRPLTGRSSFGNQRPVTDLDRIAPS